MKVWEKFGENYKLKKFIEDELLVLWKFCSRGTIQDIIYNESVTLDSKFHAAFVRDITLVIWN